jgi:Cft2 family RNA processing exonuclease
MIFVALGDTNGIGASCHFLDIQGTGLTLDAGSDPRHEGAASLPRFDLIHDHADWYVDHTIITHAHHDHMGGLPVLIKEFPHVMAHMTDATRQLLDFLLPASARLQKRKLKAGETNTQPLFTEEDVEHQSHFYLSHELEKPFDLTGMAGETPVQATFYTAGHILGSAGVEMQFEEEGTPRRVFYTSDTNVQGQSIIPGGAYPDTTDVLILESTLGNDPEMELTTREQEVQQFKAMLERIIRRGGTALVPVFVMGRAQETLALIDRFKKQGVIPPDVPVYTAGSMRAIADVYDNTRTSTPRHDADFKVFGVEQHRLPYSDEQQARSLEGPSIHVMSSGMMFEPTLSNRLARRLVEDENNGILLVGYAVEDTPARRLLDAAEQGQGTQVTLHPDKGPQPINCEVGKFRLSGHSNRQDLLRLVEQLAPQHVLLVHGEPDARAWMAEHIARAHPDIDVHLPEWGAPIEL